MSKSLAFTVYMRAEPQGSTKAFVIPGTTRAIITSANAKMKPFRSEVTRMARAVVAEGAGIEPVFGKHVPVSVDMEFCFICPESAKRKRPHPVVKPDIDKLQRAILDALTGVGFLDDSQVVHAVARKVYGAVESATVTVREV